MIENEQQYQFNLTWKTRFQDALNSIENGSADLLLIHPRLIKAQRDALVSLIEEFNEELIEYEASKKK